MTAEPSLDHDARCVIWKGAPIELCRCQDPDGYTPRTPLAEGRLLIVDTETTGVNVDEDRIVTAVVGLIEPGAETRVQSWLADPGVAIPAEAAAIHKITEEYATEHGRPAAEVVDEIDRAIAAEWGPDTPLVAMNASFDLSLIDAELRRHHNRRLRIAGPVLDPYVIDRHVAKYRPGSRKLVDLCATYRVQLKGDAHDAEADALAAARVMWRIARDYPAIGDADPGQLHVDQQRWYGQQQTSFANYLRRKVAPTVEDFDERNALLTRADQVEAQAGGWPLRVITGGTP